MEYPNHVKWALNESNTEHVAIKSFAIKFKYYSREIAERDYLALIRSTEIDVFRRKRLLQSFETFQANQPEIFWEKRIAIAKTNLYTTKAGVDCIEAGYQQSKSLYAKHFENRESSDNQNGHRNEPRTMASTTPVGTPPHTEELEIMPPDHALGQTKNNAADSTPVAPSQGSAKSPCILPDSLMESVRVRQKHPRDYDDDNTVHGKTQRVGVHPSIKDVRSESAGIHLDSELPAHLASYDQVANISTTSSASVSSPNRRISFGRSLTVEDLVYSSPRYKSRGNPRSMTTSRYSKFLSGTDLPSSDPGDLSYSSSQDLYHSTSRIYSWNYLEGDGRHDSNVSISWIYNDVDISRDLMDFRDRIVRENGALDHPHQKLAVNFAFLHEGDHQTKGLHLEIDDEPWAALCEATRDHVEQLPKETIDEVLQWVQILTRESPDALKSHLRTSPPNDLSLQSILNLMVVSGHLWDREPSNEDSFLKSWLGPFLSTYFGSITFTTSTWTHTQEETRNVDFSRLVPDFATVTATLQGELSLVLLEGKVATNKVCQVWDDKTKLGQEMKLALDSILRLSPEDGVCVVGILVREPLVEFFSMEIHSEGCYVMHRFAICHIPSDHENMISLISVMEAFQHAASKVNKTLASIRHVRVRPGPSPKIPFSWLRPSFSKPTKTLILDGQ